MELAGYWGYAGGGGTAQSPASPVGDHNVRFVGAEQRAKLLPVVSWETDCMTKEF